MSSSGSPLSVSPTGTVLPRNQSGNVVDMVTTNTATSKKSRRRRSDHVAPDGGGSGHGLHLTNSAGQLSARSYLNAPNASLHQERLVRFHSRWSDDYWTLSVLPSTTVSDVLLELSRKIGTDDPHGLCLYADEQLPNPAVDSADTATNMTDTASSMSQRGSIGGSGMHNLRLLVESDQITGVKASWGPFAADNRFWVAQRTPVATAYVDVDGDHDADAKTWSFSLSETTRVSDVVRYVAARDHVDADSLQLVLERVKSSGSSSRKPKIEREILPVNEFVVANARVAEREPNARARFIVERRRNSVPAKVSPSRSITDLLRLGARSKSSETVSQEVVAAFTAELSDITRRSHTTTSDFIRAASVGDVAHLNADGQTSDTKAVNVDVKGKRRRRRRRASDNALDDQVTVSTFKTGSFSEAQTTTNSQSPSSSPTGASGSGGSVGSNASGASDFEMPELQPHSRRVSVVFSPPLESAAVSAAEPAAQNMQQHRRSALLFSAESSSSHLPLLLGSTSPPLVGSLSRELSPNPVSMQDVFTTDNSAAGSDYLRSSNLSPSLSSTTINSLRQSSNPITSNKPNLSPNEVARIKRERVTRLRNMKAPLRTIQARLRVGAKLVTVFVYVVGVRGDDLDKDEATMIDNAPRAVMPVSSLGVSGTLHVYDTFRRLSSPSTRDTGTRQRGGGGAAAIGDGYESPSTGSGADDDSEDTTVTPRSAATEHAILDSPAIVSVGRIPTTPLDNRSVASSGRSEIDRSNDMDHSLRAIPALLRQPSVLRYPFANVVGYNDRRASYDSSMSSAHTAESFSNSRFMRSSIDVPTDTGLPTSTFNPIGVTIEMTPNENAVSIVWAVCSALCLPRWSEWGLFDSQKRIPDFEPVRSPDMSDERRPWLAMRRLNIVAAADDGQARDPASASMQSSRRSSISQNDRRPSVSVSDRRPSVSTSDRRPSLANERRPSMSPEEDGHVNVLASEVAQLRLKVAELDSMLASERQSRARAEAALARDSILTDKLTRDRTRFLNAAAAVRLLALRVGASPAHINEALATNDVMLDEIDATVHGKLPTLSSSISESSSDSSSSASSQPNRRYMIDWADLRVLEQIGEGAASTVYYGHYRGQEVAIKVLRSIGSDDRTFWNECQIMHTLRATETVYFYGATAKPNVAIVLEYCARGSLFDAMRRPQVQWPWAFVLRIMGQVATGLCALHGWKPSIVHRDLKSSNLMLDIHWKVKIGDFGVARCGDDNSDDDVQGTYAYIAPELYHGSECTAAVDIYSFGIIMWEVVNRAVVGAYAPPYTTDRLLVQNFQILLLAALHNVRPAMPHGVPNEIRNIVERCWQGSPTTRPTAPTLAELLDNATDAETNQRRSWGRKLFGSGKGKAINSET